MSTTDNIITVRALHQYGTTRYEIIGRGREPVYSLTGTKTLTPRHLHALEILGLELVPEAVPDWRTA